MVWFGQLVLDAVLVADTIEDVGAEIAPGRAVAVLGQIGEGHAVVGQHGMDGVGERLDHAAQELAPFIFPASSRNST